MLQSSMENSPCWVFRELGIAGVGYSGHWVFRVVTPRGCFSTFSGAGANLKHIGQVSEPESVFCQNNPSTRKIFPVCVPDRKVRTRPAFSAILSSLAQY